MIVVSVETADGLVADDYYKQGKEINLVIKRDKKSAELGLSAVIDFDNSSKVINLQFNKGLLEYYPQSLNLHIQHATREKRDLTVLLHHGIGDRYIGHVKHRISKGIWYFGIGNEEWKLNARTHVQSTNIINLQSKY